MKKKLLAMLMAAAMAVTGVPSSVMAQETSADAQKETAETSGTNAADGGAAAALSDTQWLDDGGITRSGEAYISNFLVSNCTTGTAPFDTEEGAGNDTSPTDSIVRSFDYVNYELTYTTSLTDSEVVPDGGRLCVEFILPYGADKVSFDESTLNWVEDYQLITVDENGDAVTESKPGDTVYQVMTGYRTLSSESANAQLPGTGTLSVGLYVKNAKNGSDLTPIFMAWMESEETDETADDYWANAGEETMTAEGVNTIYVSAAPNYKIQIKQSSGLELAGTYDLGEGENGAATVGDGGDINGRLEGFGITLMMYNENVGDENKGLKGLEFSAGDISFDLTLSETLSASDGAEIELDEEDTTYTPVIWDYDENAQSRNVSNGATGNWGRTLYNYSWASGAAPANKIGQTSFNTVYDSCYDGGTWEIVQDEENPLLYHVTVSGYEIDFNDYVFPTADLAATSARVSPGTTYKANEACFSAGYVQVVAQYPKSSELTENTKIELKVVADNFKVSEMVEDENGDEQKVWNDSYEVEDTKTVDVQLVVPGEINVQVWYGNKGNTSMSDYGSTDSGILGSGTSAGNAYAFLGSEVRINARCWISGDTEGHTVMEFTKWDADCFDVTGCYNVWWSNSANSSFETGKWSDSCTIYYVGRDSNWQSEQEMSNTLINDNSLTFYESREELDAAGKVCIGALLVARGTDKLGDLRVGYQSTIKESADIGSVYAACTEGWVSTMTYEELTKGDSDSEFSGYGALIKEDHTINADLVKEGYDLYKAYCDLDSYKAMKDSPEYSKNSHYIKSEYDENGNIKSGTNVTACYGGNSLLICGEKDTVFVGFDRDVYDLDAGQRTAQVTVSPYVDVTGSHSTSGDGTVTTVTIAVTLPSDLTYIEGTAMWGDEYINPTVEVNSDGTTTLTFVLEGVQVKQDEAIDVVTFDCTIGHAGTADDLANNEEVSISAAIGSTYDNRAKSSSFGNYAETSFVVVKLASTSISKTVDSARIEKDGEFVWTLSYYNGSDADVTQTEIADIFPQNQDPVAANFGDFNGTYEITKIEIDFSEGQDSYTKDHESLDFYVTTEPYVGDGEDFVQNGKSIVTNGSWVDLMDHKGISPDSADQDYVEDDDASAYTITLDTSKENLAASGIGLTDNAFTAFYCDLGQLKEHNTVQIRIYVKTKDNEAGDTYVNTFYEAADSTSVKTDKVVAPYASENETEESQVEVTSNQVTTTVVERAISGRVWYDKNQNGLQDSYDADGDGNADTEEPAAEGVSVTLKKQTGEAAPYDLVPVTDVYGNTVESVKTGEDGSYLFAHLLDGEYTIEFSGINGYIYGVTEANVGTDKSENSNAVLSSNTDGALVAQISDVTLLPIGDIVGYRDIDPNEDLGLTDVLISIEGTKVWDDADDQDGRRPSYIIINLFADNEKVLDQTGNAACAIVTEDDNWAFSFTDLPKYNEDGTEIVYTITETAVYGYETTISDLVPSTQAGDEEGYEVTVTNTHEPETVSINGEKVWDDDDDRDGLRPQEITISLLANGSAVVDEDGLARTAEVTAADGWAFSFTDLPKYEDGEEINYQIVEVQAEGYSTETSWSGSDEEGVYTVTVKNAYTPQQTSIQVLKDWDDGSDQDGIRPQSVTVHLYADGTDTGLSLDLSAVNHWQGSFTALDVYRDGGTEIVYSVVEEAVDGYTADVSDLTLTADQNAESGTYVVTVKNSHVPQTLMIFGEKIWDDGFDQDGIRPEDITLYLLKTVGEETAVVHKTTVTPAEDGSWIFAYTDLPKYAAGTEIAYTLLEAAVDGYETEIMVFDQTELTDELTGEGTGVYTAEAVVTNTHVPETIGIYGSKVWDDDNDRDGVRPASITITLLANGSAAVDEEGLALTAEVTAADGWTFAFADLPKYAAGTEIAYTLLETAVDDYEASIYLSDPVEITDEQTGEGTGIYTAEAVVTNTHVPKTVSVSVQKVWDDADDQDGLRPQSVTVQLYADGEAVSGAVLVLSKENGWAGSFDGLPYYRDGGERIAYTVEETDVPYGYTAEVTVTETQAAAEEDASDENADEAVFKGAYAYTITNTHVPKNVSVSVQKVWDDADDQDGLRPQSVTVQLYADGEAVSGAVLVLSEENGWAGSFDGLPYYRDGGVRIEYTVEETDVPEGYTVSVTADENDPYAFTVTNRHVPAEPDETTTGTPSLGSPKTADAGLLLLMLMLLAGSALLLLSLLRRAGAAAQKQK